LNAKETAVVMIEFQNEFCRPDGKLHGLVKDELQRQNTIANAVKMVKAARAKGCLIIHSPFVFDETWAKEQCLAGIIGNAGSAGAFRPGQWGSELIDELKPERGDVLLKGKLALSRFTNTELAEVLGKHKIKYVVCAGFLSNVCVESTARAAYDQGFQVTIVKNACAASSKSNQDYVEKEIYPLLGKAMSADEFVSSLE